MKHKDKTYLYVSLTNYISSDFFSKFLDTNILLYNGLHNIGERGIFISNFKYCYFVNKGEFFFEGQILNHYDNKDNLIGQVKLVKFIRHYHLSDKTPYVCVSIKFLNGNKNDLLTFDAEKYLGNLFTTKVRNFKNSIDK